MSKKIGLFWLKDDFRLNKNPALSEATKNHNTVVAFYLFKKKKFENQGWSYIRRTFKVSLKGACISKIR